MGGIVGFFAGLFVGALLASQTVRWVESPTATTVVALTTMLLVAFSFGMAGRILGGHVDPQSPVRPGPVGRRGRRRGGRRGGRPGHGVAAGQHDGQQLLGGTRQRHPPVADHHRPGQRDAGPSRPVQPGPGTPVEGGLPPRPGCPGAGVGPTRAAAHRRHPAGGRAGRRAVDGQDRGLRVRRPAGGFRLRGGPGPGGDERPRGGRHRPAPGTGRIGGPRHRGGATSIRRSTWRSCGSRDSTRHRCGSTRRPCRPGPRARCSAIREVVPSRWTAPG